MSHDDFDFEPLRGLPAPLPAGEQLLWQGSPSFKGLALRAYHVRKVIVYFLGLAAWRVAVGLIYSQPRHDVLVSCLLLVVMACLAAAVLCTLAYCSSRSTVYTITSRRVLLRHGIAVPMTLNVPFKSIDGAGVKVFSNGSGDIALTVAKDQRVGYLITWPHLRPGYITRPQPSFRALGDVETAARILGQALARDAGVEAADLEPLRSRSPSHTAGGASGTPGGSRSATPRAAVA
jgi:hypothetical protein